MAAVDARRARRRGWRWWQQPAGDRGHPGTVRATWRGVVLAESDDTVRVEGNHYFPESVRWECFVESPTTSLCVWKGRARYLSVAVDDAVLPDAAWYYPRPWPWVGRIADRVAFWGAVHVEDHR
ncbi:MAG: DUF427 domain-containing protein [Actinobacteria bacterium]|nr:DUF427 domain-containing protein [Actinomycetota bacterium]